jgi:hypothetical protein
MKSASSVGVRSIASHTRASVEMVRAMELPWAVALTSTTRTRELVAPIGPKQGSRRPSAGILFPLGQRPGRRPRACAGQSWLPPSRRPSAKTIRRRKPGSGISMAAIGSTTLSGSGTWIEVGSITGSNRPCRPRSSGPGPSRRSCDGDRSHESSRDASRDAFGRLDRSHPALVPLSSRCADRELDP